MMDKKRLVEIPEKHLQLFRELKLLLALSGGYLSEGLIRIDGQEYNDVTVGGDLFHADVQVQL